MSVQPEPPLEARLIQQRRETVVPAMSRRQAAARAGISASQWSDIERGTKKAGQGAVVPIRATAQTLARMARAVEATADELAAAGREDAASLLRGMEQDRGLRQRLAAVPGLGAITAHLLSGTDGQELLPIIAAGLDAIDNSDLPGQSKRELTAMFTDNLINDAARRHAELLLTLRIAARASHPG